jgi:hypothetical protein
MKIRDKDIYYGVALTQIAEYPTFTSINKVTEKEGLYQINDDVRILIKYSTAVAEWQFTFRKDDFTHFTLYRCFVVLVCGLDAICLLPDEQLSQLMDLEKEGAQWVRVTYPEGGQMRVSGSEGDLSYCVALDDFPKDIFGAITKSQEKYFWPPFCKINIYKQAPELIFSTVNRGLDLVDSITRNLHEGESKTVFFGLSTVSYLWDTWNQENVRKIEERIKYDLEFDGFKVDIERVTEVIPPPRVRRPLSKLPALCSKQFVWRLNIAVEDIDEEE